MYAPFHGEADLPEFFEDLLTRLTSLIEIHVPSATILAGDFNAHLFRQRTARDKQFADFTRVLTQDGYECFPRNEKPYTYISGRSNSTIDHVFTRGLRIAGFEVVPHASAQHRPLHAVLEIPFLSTIEGVPAVGTAYWKSALKEKDFPDSLRVLDPITTNPTPHGLQAYYDKFANLISLATKRTRRKQPVQSWECFLMAGDVAELHRVQEAVSKTSRGSDTNPVALEQLHVRKKELELLTTKLMRKSLDAETQKLSEKASSHVDAWSVLSKLQSPGLQCPVPTDKLHAHFAKLSKTADTPLLPKPLPLPTGDTSDYEPLDPQDLTSALRDVNQASAAVPDGISPRMLCKTFATDVAFEFLFNLLAMCLLLAFVPDQWREATFFALYKGAGDPCDPSNYRGIALTSSFAKLYERVLLHRLLRWLRNSRLWMLPQFGFRSRCSCMHAIFLLRTTVLDVLRSGKGPVFAAFVDLQKAFPSVGRDALFDRMLRLGIPYYLVAAIRSFYVSNVARLRIDNSLTKDFFVAVGVLEGSVLSPCLFGVLFSVIWDLFQTTAFPTVRVRLYTLESMWFIAYADDLVILTLSAEKLERTLNKMSSELRKLNLKMRCLYIFNTPLYACIFVLNVSVDSIYHTCFFSCLVYLVILLQISCTIAVKYN